MCLKARNFIWIAQNYDLENTHIQSKILFARISTELDIPFLKVIPNKHIYNKKILQNSFKPSPILLSPFCREEEDTNNLIDFIKIT